MGAGTGPDAHSPVAPGRGPGWARLAEAVAGHVPPAEIETIYLFRPLKREGREWGTAVVARRSAEGSGRLRVYTARYMLVVRGKERGQTRVEVAETGLSLAEVSAQVCRGPAAMAWTPPRMSAAGGQAWLSVVPSPSWPEPFSPQQRTPPALVSAQVW